MSGGAQQPDQPEAALSAEAIAAESVRLEEEQAPARSVVGAAMIVSGATAVSRVTGLIRDVMLAMLFGFSREMDAFFLAFTVPNLFRKLFGEGALSSATVPVLSRYRVAGDMAATRRYLGTLMTLLFFGLSAATLLIIAIAHMIPAEAMPDPEWYRQFRDNLTVLLPYVIFICLSALQAGALNCWNRFGLPALVPALANVGWIAILVGIWFSPWRGDTRFAVLVMSAGILVTGVLQWGVQVPALAKLKLLARPQMNLSEPGVRATFKAMAPMLLALAVFQINTFLDQVLAKALVAGDGAVSSYTYASRLFQLPLGVVAVALGTAMFPLMSRFAARNDLTSLTASLLNSVRLLAFVAFPAAAGLAVLALPITELLFSGPNSEPEMLQRSARVLALLCISLPIVSVISLLTKASYSLGEYKAPTRIALLAVAVNVVANVVLLQTPLMEAGVALGTAISGALNLVLLVLTLRKRLRGTVMDSLRAAAVPAPTEQLAQPFTPSAVRALPLSLLRSLAVTVLMAAAAFAVEHALFGSFGLEGRASRVLSVLGAVAAGVVIYAGASLLLRAQEVGQILTLRGKRSSAEASG